MIKKIAAAVVGAFLSSTPAQAQWGSILAPGGSPPVGPQFVQAQSQGQSGAASSLTTPALTTPVPAGHTLIAYCVSSSGGGDSGVPTDAGGDTFVDFGPNNIDFNTTYLSAYIAKNVAANSAETVTCNYAGSNTFPIAGLIDLSAASTSAPVDNVGYATSGSSPISVSVTTSSSPDLMLCLMATQGSTNSPASGYTIAYTDVFGGIVQTKTVLSAGSQSGGASYTGGTGQAAMICGSIH